MSEPKILLLDVETAPIIAHVWGLWDQRVGLNQILQDSHLLSWAAKWYHEDYVYYMDQRKKKDLTDDKELVNELAKMIDDADILVTQNGKRFDEKVIKGRMVIHGLKPIGGYKHFDTLQIAKRHFRFTSNKLEYMAKALKVPHKKLTIRKFDGHHLWVECLKGNKEAWKEMEEYNCLDVLVLEEIYDRLKPWDSSIDHNIYRTDGIITCTCGSTQFVRDGFKVTSGGKYQRYQCKSCGRKTRGSENLLSKEDRKRLPRKV